MWQRQCLSWIFNITNKMMVVTGRNCFDVDQIKSGKVFALQPMISSLFISVLLLFS